MSSENNSGIGGIVILGLLGLGVIGSCNNSGSTTTSTSSPTYTSSHSDYHDMRSRGHSEEDAVIFQMLKNQGYSDYDALNATMSSKE